MQELAPFDPERPELPAAVTRQVEIRVKYAGYLQRQEQQIEAFRREESRLLPEDADYASIAGCASRRGRSWPTSARAPSGRPGASPAFRLRTLPCC